MNSDRARQLRVGALMISAFVLFVFALFWIGQDSGWARSTYPLTVKLMKVPGLIPGSPVRLGGLRVGYVRDITFSNDPGDPFLYVELKVQSRFAERIRADSRAKLGSLGLLGDKVIDISPGSPKAPVLEAYDLVRSAEVTELDALLDRAAQMIDNLDTASQDIKQIVAKINTGEGSLAKFLNDPRFYTNLDSLLIVCTELAMAVRNNDGTIGALFNDRRLYDNLLTFVNSGNSLVMGIQNGQGTAGKLVKDPSLYNHLDSMSLSIRRLSDRLQQPDSSSLGALLADKQFSDDLKLTIKNLNDLIVDLKTNPKRYVRLSLF